MRLDKYLVDENYFESRNRANDAIKAKKIKVDGKVAKASLKVNKNSIIEVENEKFYASRAGRKLEQFLLEYPLDLKGARALDIGSSTGGFAQIILENEVNSLACVDVGKNQLHISLSKDEKLSLYEEQDIRTFKDREGFDLITCDVSFISILQIIESIDSLARSNATIIILYKPQFEVGKDVKRDSRGVVQDMDAISRRQEEFELEILKLNWCLKYKTPSQIKGKNGNLEYIYCFVKHPIMLVEKHLNNSLLFNIKEFDKIKRR